MPRLMPRDIMPNVLKVLVDARKGKGRSPCWLTAYQIFLRLPYDMQTRLEKERGRMGKDSGRPFAAATVIAMACKRLKSEKKADLDYLDTGDLEICAGKRQVRPSFQVCGIYRATSAGRQSTKKHGPSI